jgi:hypothetical protein
MAAMTLGRRRRASSIAEEMNDSKTARHRNLRVLSLSKRLGLRKKTSKVENPGSDTGVPDVFILFPCISRSTPQNFNPLAKLSTYTQKKAERESVGAAKIAALNV